MTDPRRPAESPFASIRELADTERRIMQKMDVMKHELLAAIKVSDEHHEHTHSTMRTIGDERHRRIDDFFGKEALDDAQRTGMMTAGTYTIRAIRLVNELRWLIVALVLGVIFLVSHNQ